MKSKNNNISCLVYRDAEGGYDCEYEFAGWISCENCVCNGGKLDPRTGKKISKKSKKSKINA